MKDKIVQFFKPKNELDNLVKEIEKLKKDKPLICAAYLYTELNARKIGNMSEEEWDKYEKETGNPRLDKVIKNEEELEIANHKFIIYRVLKIEKEIKNIELIVSFASTFTPYL